MTKSIMCMCICFVIFYYAKSDKSILKYMHAHVDMYRWLLHPHGVPSSIPVVYPLTSPWCTLLLG